ncbi:MAG: hypothetical protein RLY86_1556 [Pseudomonadota bacterium]|jgi:alkylation response protein AidB-like acyl-CoA dehydrogenase
MIGFTLTEEQLLLQKTARDFARQEIAPVVRRLRHQPQGADTWAAVRPIIAKGAGLGFMRLLLPEVQGGLGGTCLDACLLMEELGAADVGIAADYFSLTACMPLMIVRGGTAEQQARLIPPFVSDSGFIAAGAQSEANVGGSELMSMDPDPKLGPKTTAKRAPGGYSLTGSKSAFITNAGVAEGYFIIARTDPAAPVAQSLTIFWVPADSPGLSHGPNTELIGWKASHHAELYLDSVFVPEENRIGGEGAAGMLFARLPEMPVCLAACFVGLARAAYDYALDYAKTRVSNGKPIIQHQAVALKLADMAVDVQAARLLVWDAAAACETDWMTAAALKGPAAKTAAVDAAIRNAERAVQILGGYGVTTEYDAGAMLTDAWVGYACDFTRDVLRLGMVPFLKGTE